MTLDHLRKEQVINSLRKLETHHLLQNLFLNELNIALNNCYDYDLNLKAEKIEILLNLIGSHIDGIISSALELSNTNSMLNTVCEIVEEM